MSGSEAPAPAAPAPVTPAAPAAAAPAAPAAPAVPAAAPPAVAGNVLGEAIQPDPAAPAAPAVPEVAPEPIKPESYLEALKLPEGLAKDDPLLTSFLDGAARGGMDQESVQAVVEAMGPQITKALSAPYEAWKSLQEQWQGAVKTDPVIGGDKTAAVVATINRALTQVCGADLPAVKEALEITGGGNNPAIIKAFYLLAQGLVERSGPVTGTPTDPRPAGEAAAKLYPSAAKAAA